MTPAPILPHLFQTSLYLYDDRNILEGAMIKSTLSYPSKSTVRFENCNFGQRRESFHSFIRPQPGTRVSTAPYVLIKRLGRAPSAGANYSLDDL